MRESTLFSNKIEAFLQFCQIEKGLAENTIQAYERDLQDFVRWCSEKGVHRLEILMTENLVEYLAWLWQVRQLDGASRVRHRISLRQFFKFLVEQEILTEDPASALNGPRTQMPIPSVISFEQVDAILTMPGNLLQQQAGNLTKSKRSQLLRDMAMLELMYGTGLRVSELISLKKEHWKEDFIEVVGKGNKQRIVPLTMKLKQMVHQYWETLEGVSSDYVFLSTHKKPMTRQNFWMIIKKYAKQAGVEVSVTPHGLRHAFATHLLQNGMNLRHLQALLGHADISTTQIYTHVANTQLVFEHRSHHPRGQ